MEGWFVGFVIDDPTLWAAVKRGERPQFSIGGSAQSKEISDADVMKLTKNHGRDPEEPQMTRILEKIKLSEVSLVDSVLGTAST
jgi:hypothetical protein